MKKIILSISIILTSALVFISLTFFSKFINHNDWNLSNDLFESNVINTIALIFAAIGFGVSGYITQSIVRNNLATPSTTGITPIITLAIIISTILGFTLLNQLLFSILIGLIFSILIIFIISKTQNTSISIIIFGVILTGIILGINQIIINVYNVPRYVMTILNNIKPNISWKTLYILMPIILVPVFLLFILSPKIKIIEQGGTHAKNLGIGIKSVILISWLLVIIISTAYILLAGMITFASLAAPLLVRCVFRTKNIYLNLLLSILFSIIFILTGDILARYKTYYIIAFVPVAVSAILIVGRILWK